MLCRLLVLWLAVGAACVVIPDPDHCANKSGDATCEALDADRRFCSSCLRTNNGCVDNTPTDDCRPAPADEATTASSQPTSGPSDSSSVTMSETGPSTCVPECAADAPYCIEAQCTTCGDAGGDDFCAGLDPSTPQCHPTWGTCVACFGDGSPACEPDESFCDDAFACGGCTEHAQCPASACDLETGRCMDDAPQLWVDNQECVKPAMGTQESPYCTIAEAIALIGASDTTAVIRLANGAPYGEAIEWNACDSERRLAVLGIGGFPAAIQGDPNVAEVRCANTLYLANVRLITGTATGVYCEEATLWLDDSVLIDNLVGLDATGCRTHVRRTQILRSETFGIRTSNDTDLWLASSIIGSGGAEGTMSRAIEATTGTADIRFTTVAGNRGDGKPSLWCAGAVAGSVRNSIFVSPGGGSVACTQLEFTNTAFDDAELAMEGTDNVPVYYDSSWFVNPMEDDYHLLPTAPLGYLEGGRWVLGDPRVDIDGDPRSGVPETTESLGADAL